MDVELPSMRIEIPPVATSDPRDRSLFEKIFSDAAAISNGDVSLQQMLESYDAYKPNLDSQTGIRIYRLILQWGRSRPQSSFRVGSVERSPRSIPRGSSTASCSAEPPPLQPIHNFSPNRRVRRSMSNDMHRMNVRSTSPFPIPPNLPKPCSLPSKVGQRQVHNQQIYHNHGGVDKENFSNNENANPNVPYTPHFQLSPRSSIHSTISQDPEIQEVGPPPPPLRDRFVQADRPVRPQLSVTIARQQACDEIDLCEVEERPRTPPLPTPSPREGGSPETLIPKERKPVTVDNNNNTNVDASSSVQNVGKKVEFSERQEDVMEISMREEDARSPENVVAALAPRLPNSPQVNPVNEGPLVLAPFGNGPAPSLADLQAAQAYNVVRIARFCFGRWAVNTRLREMQEVKQQYVKRIARRVLFRWQQRTVAHKAWLSCLKDVQEWSTKACLSKHLSRWRDHAIQEKKCRIATIKIESLTNACSLARAFRIWHSVRAQSIQHTQWLATAGFQAWANYARQKGHLKDTLKQAQEGLTIRFNKRLVLYRLANYALEKRQMREQMSKAERVWAARTKFHMISTWIQYVGEEKQRKVIKEALASKAQRHRIRCAIRTWSRGTRKRIMTQRLQTFAAQFAYRSSISKGLQKWHVRAHEKRMHRQNFQLMNGKLDKKMTKNVFYEWRRRTRFFKQQEQKSEEIRWNNLMPKIFKRWRKHASQSVYIRKMQTRCDDHLHLFRLDQNFTTWKNNVTKDRAQLLGADNGPPENSNFVMGAYKWMKMYSSCRALEQLKRARKLGKDVTDLHKEDDEIISTDFVPKGWRALWPTPFDVHPHRVKIVRPAIFQLFAEGFTRQILRSWRAVTLLRKYQELALHYRRLRNIFDAYRSRVNKQKMNRQAEEQLAIRHRARTLRDRFGYWFRRLQTRKTCRDELLTFRVNLNVRCTRNALQEWRRVASRRAQAHRNAAIISAFTHERIRAEFFEDWYANFEESRRFRLMAECARLQFAKNRLASCFETLRWWSSVSCKGKIVAERRSIFLQQEVFRAWRKARAQSALAQKYNKIVNLRNHARLRKNAFETLQWYAARKISLRNRLQSFMTSNKRLLVPLSFWIEYVDEQKEIRANEKIADNYRRAIAYKKSIVIWKEYVHFSKTIGKLEKMIVGDHTSHAMTCWQSYYEEHRAYEIKAIGILFVKRFKSVLNAWKTVVRHERIISHMDLSHAIRTRRSCIRAWKKAAEREKVIRHKTIVMDITRDRSLTMHALFVWKSFAHREIRDRVVTNRITDMREQRELRTAFETFHENVLYFANQRSALHRFSDNHEGRLCVAAWKRWNSFVYGHTIARSLANQHDNNHLLSSLLAWRETTRKRIAIRTAGETLEDMHNKKIRAEHFRKWADRHRRRVKFRSDLIKFRLDHTARQISPILKTWQVNARAAIRLRQIEQKNRKKCMKFALVHWARGNANSKRQTYALAKAVRRGSLYLERVVLHTFKHALKSKKCEDQRLVAADDRADIIRIQKAWLGWKQYIQQEERERALNEVADLGRQRFLQKRAMTGWLIYLAEWLTARYQLSEITKNLRIRELKTFIVSWRRATVEEIDRRAKLDDLQKRVEMRLATTVLISWNKHTKWCIRTYERLADLAPTDFCEVGCESQLVEENDSLTRLDAYASNVYQWRNVEKMFCRWRDVAPEMYNSRLDKIHAAQEWGNSRIDSHLVKLLKGWRSTAEPRMRVSAGARAVANTRRLRKALVSWKDTTKVRKVARDRAETYHAIHLENVLRTFFFAYQDVVARRRWLRLAQANVQNRHEQLITRSYFVNWIKAVVYHGKEVMFKSMLQQKMLRNVVTGWQRTAQVERLVHTRTEHLRLQYLQFVFKSWRVVAVAEKRRSWWRRNILWHWRCAAKRRKWDRALVFHCRVARNRAILAADFAKWQRRFDLRRRVRHMSSNRPMLQRGIFRVWRQFAEQRARTRRIGQAVENKTKSNILKKVCGKWGLLFAAKLFARRHDPELVQDCFSAWQSEVEYKKISSFVENYYSARRMKVCIKALQAYARRKKFLRECQTVLENNHRTNLMYNNFNCWVYNAQRDISIRIGLERLEKLRKFNLVSSTIIGWRSCTEEEQYTRNIEEKAEDFRIAHLVVTAYQSWVVMLRARQKLIRADSVLTVRTNNKLCKTAFIALQKLVGLGRFARLLERHTSAAALRFAGKCVFRDILDPVVQWRKKVKELGDKYPRIIESIAYAKSYEKARPGLNRWHEFAKLAGPRRKKNQQARYHARAKLLFKALLAWSDYRDCRLHHRALDLKALRFFNTRIQPFRMRCALELLEQNRTERKEIRAAMDIFSERCARRRLRLVIDVLKAQLQKNGWYDVYESEAKLRAISDEVRRRCAERRLFDTYTITNTTYSHE